MTDIVLLADPPRRGLVLPELVDSSPLTTAEATTLYRGMLRDVATAVRTSGGELLVNYRPDEALPSTFRTDRASADELRDVLADVAPDARYEPQVGESYAGRVGNAITHLLDREEVQTAAAVDPTAIFLTRAAIDSAAMKLRRHEVVLGPSLDGRVTYAGFASSVDFSDAFAPPAVRTLTDRAIDAGLGVDFLPMQPVLEWGADLPTVLAVLDARRRAGAPIPTEVATGLDMLRLVTEDTGRPTVTRTDRP